MTMDSARFWSRALIVAGAVLLVLMSGLLPLAFIANVPMGGVLDTGQADPMRWAFAAGLISAGAGLLWCGSLWPWLVGIAMWSAIITFCVVAGSAMDWGAAAFLAIWLALILFATSLRSVMAAVGALALAAAVAVFATNDAAGVFKKADRAGVMTALPLFWSEGTPQAQVDRARDQAFVDASRWQLEAIDVLNKRALAPTRHLLLAQPRLLAPTELVALDRWVRDGGKLVVLADPLLTWPTKLPLGDPLRAPLTCLLDPLLEHWGLRLEPVAPQHIRVVRAKLSYGQVLLLAAPSRFTRMGGACTLVDDGLMATCRIGKGAVRLIADADLIDDRLWLARDDHPRARSARASDAVALIDFWLGDPLASPPPATINRVQGDGALIAGLRWAILVGMGWVGVGAAWIFRRDRRNGDRQVTGSLGTGAEH